VDDTGFPKKGRHSVGVARQYCGQLGKQDNCQVAVSLSIANVAASLPIAYRLYLPEIWADDPERRRKAKIPDSIAFQTKPAIALDQIRAAQAAGVAPGVVLADAGYGADGAFRTGLSGLGLDYVVGVQPTLSVWRPGEEPLPPKHWRGKGRPTSLMRRSPDHRPISVKAMAHYILAALSGHKDKHQRAKGLREPTEVLPLAARCISSIRSIMQSMVAVMGTYTQL